MTPEETNKLYKKAFRCITYSIDKDNNILSRIKEFARRYDYLEIQQPVKVIPQDERKSHPLLTLDQIAELKAKDHSGIYAFLKVETIFQKIKKDVIDIKGKQKQIFERLKKSVEKEKYVINQVQDLKRDRIIGVIGKDHSLIRGIVTYLWLTQPTNSNKPPEWLSCKTPLRQCICSIIGKHIPERIDFLYVPCKGLNETEIKKLLPQIQDKRLNEIETRMVFLGDINCDSRNNVLNMLVGMVEDGFIRKRNIVISMDTLPAEFEDQFDPIYLEPKKQDTAKAQGITTFPLSQGDKVSDIKIVLLNDTTACVTVNRETKTLNYSQMGFLHKQTGDPKPLWDTVLEYAEGGVGVSQNSKGRKQKRGERINKILQKFFVTDKNLISGNQPLFNISKKRRQDQRPINIQSKNCSDCNKPHKNYCYTCNEETEKCKDCHDEFYKEAHKGLNGRLHKLIR